VKGGRDFFGAGAVILQLMEDSHFTVRRLQINWVLHN